MVKQGKDNAMAAPPMVDTMGVRWFRFSVPAMQQQRWAVAWLEEVPRRRPISPPRSTATALFSFRRLPPVSDVPFFLEGSPCGGYRGAIRVQVTVKPADCFDGVPSPVQRRKHATAATPAVAVAPPSGAAWS
nr:hypothetical protein Iba_scaffold8881CG0060 [Ipomoea batatas]